MRFPGTDTSPDFSHLARSLDGYETDKVWLSYFDVTRIAVDNIIQFPTNMARTWAETERWLKDVAIRAGRDESLGSEVAAQIKPLFDLLHEDIPISLNVPSEECATAIKEQEALFAESLLPWKQRILMERITREFLLHSRHGRL